MSNLLKGFKHILSHVTPYLPGSAAGAIECLHKEIDQAIAKHDELSK